jgi:catechol 2,3-dioxygenase-like lactoylglutathione lyase family enzyme
MEDPAAPQIAQVVLDTTNPRASAEFWRQFLGLVYRSGHEPPPPGADDPRGGDWLNLLRQSGEPCLAFQRVATLEHSTWPESTIPQQLHLDLTVGSIEALRNAHDRVIALGGELRFDRSDSPEEPLQVFSDVDGHPFCVFVVFDE